MGSYRHPGQVGHLGHVLDAGLAPGADSGPALLDRADPYGFGASVAQQDAEVGSRQALDGARFLAGEGFSSVVCHLVAHYSASTYEAKERGIALAAYAEFQAPYEGLGPAHAVLWWADLTTGPQGQEMTVEERLDDIAARYAADEVVARNAAKNRTVLLAAGQTPTGSIQVRW